MWCVGVPIHATDEGLYFTVVLFSWLFFERPGGADNQQAGADQHSGCRPCKQAMLYAIETL